MASKSAIPKQLKEHLKDQQEPFTLNIYLSERGYLVKCLSSNGRNGGCCQINLFKNLWNKKMVLHSTRVVKSVLYKLVSGNNIDDSSEPSCCSNNYKGNEDEFQIADSSSQASKPGNLEPAEENLVSRCQRECIHDKQIDLMSTLNKLSSEKVHHIITGQKSRRNSIDPTENVKGNFVFASFPWKLLGKSLMERYTLIGFKEAKGTIITQPCTLQYCRRNQELWSQRKSLFNLSDKKPLKNNDGTNVGNKYNYIHWFIGLKNMACLIGAEQIYTCRKNSRHSSSSMSFLDSFEEWRYSKLQRNIGLDLGDAIMDDIIEEVIDLLWH